MTSSALVPAARRIAGDLLAQPLAQPGVERRERLVEQHDLRVGRQRAGERDSLALAARELVRVGAARSARPTSSRHSAARSAASAPKPTLARDRQVREQRAVLEDHADAALLGLDPGAGAGHLAPPIRTLPASGRSKPAISRSSVVLPEPLGPTSGDDAPRSTRRRRRRPPRVRRTPCASVDLDRGRARRRGFSIRANPDSRSAVRLP